MLDALKWWAAIQLLALIAAPLSLAVLAPLADRGWGLSKALGLLLFAYVVWLLGVTHVAPNGPIAYVVAMLILAGGSIYLLRRNGGERGWRAGLEELTAFLRHELAQCEHNVAVGEDIRYLVRDEANALDLPDHDFWVFDDERVALLYFTADDRLLGAQIVTEPAVVAAHVHWLDLATRHARPYQQYVAEDPSRVRPPG